MDDGSPSPIIHNTAQGDQFSVITGGQISVDTPIFPLYENVNAGTYVYDTGVYDYKNETSYLAYCDDEHTIEKGELYKKIDSTNVIDFLFLFIIIIAVTDLIITRGNSTYYYPALLSVPLILIRRYVYMLMEFNATITSATISGVIIRLTFVLVVILYLSNLKDSCAGVNPFSS